VLRRKKEASPKLKQREWAKIKYFHISMTWSEKVEVKLLITEVIFGDQRK
jgi:hypothetical protein